MKSLSVAELDRVTLVAETAEAFCQGQLSCDVAALNELDTAPSLLLSPQGKLVSILRVKKVDTSQFELYITSGWGESVATALDRFNLGSKIEIAVDSVSVVRYRATIDAHEETVQDEEYVPEFWGTEWVARDYLKSEAKADGSFLDCRIAAGVVEMGSEIFEGDIPASAPIISGYVSFEKGCYLGQELVARMSSRNADPPQRIVRVHGAGLSVGAEILSDSEVVGKVLSLAGNDNIGGLAVLKRKAPIGEYATASGETVVVSDLEFDASKSG